MPKILVIEDDPGVQTLLSRILTRQGFAVECADDGGEGLDRLAAAPYDAILLDLTMPKISGLDVLRRLEDDGRADILSRVIVVTAASAKEVSRLQRVAVIRKPFDIHELMVTLCRITGCRLGNDGVVAVQPERALRPC